MWRAKTESLKLYITQNVSLFYIYHIKELPPAGLKVAFKSCYFLPSKRIPSAVWPNKCHLQRFVIVPHIHCKKLAKKRHRNVSKPLCNIHFFCRSLCTLCSKHSVSAWYGYIRICTASVWLHMDMPVDFRTHFNMLLIAFLYLCRSKSKDYYSFLCHGSQALGH